MKQLRTTLNYILAQIGEGYTVIRYSDYKGLQTVTGAWAKTWAEKLQLATPYEFDNSMDCEFKTVDEPLTDYSHLFSDSPSPTSEERVQDMEPSLQIKFVEPLPQLGVDMTIEEISQKFGEECIKLAEKQFKKWHPKNEEAIGEQPDWKYSPHFKDDAQGHIFSNDENRMLFNLVAPAATTQKQLNKDANKLITAVNAYPALIKENQQLKDDLSKAMETAYQENKTAQQQAKDIEGFKQIAKIAQEDLEFLLKKVQPGSYRAAFTIAELNKIIYTKKDN